MKYSIFAGENANQTRTVHSVREDDCPGIAEDICRHIWSPIVFHSINGEMQRNSKSFCQIDLLVLDIDKDLPLKEAPKVFSSFTHIIGTTRNHQKAKGNQEKTDRLRVIIPFEKTITNPAAYLETWKHAKTLWPFIDPSCKDLARFYFPCTEVVSTHISHPFWICSSETKGTNNG